MSNVAVEVACQVDAFAGFTMAGEDAFRFGLDATGVVNELSTVTVPGESFDGMNF